MLFTPFAKRLLPLFALAPLTGMASTVNYSLAPSCSATQVISGASVPHSNSGAASCNNTINSTVVGIRDVDYSFSADYGQFSGSFSSTYTSTQWHGGGQIASVFLDDLRYSDSFTVVYDDPSVATPVNLTMHFLGDVKNTVGGSGFSSNGTLQLGIVNPNGTTASRGITRFDSTYSGFQEPVNNLNDYAMSLYHGQVVTMNMFADFYTAGSLGQGISGIYPDVSFAKTSGFFQWWVDVPVGVTLVSASGHNYALAASAVPEASSLWLALAGLGIVFGMRKRSAFARGQAKSLS